MPFLDEWQVLLKDIRQLTPERVSGLLDRAERLRQQADLAGQGGVVHHLEVCIHCLQSPALDRRGFGEALRNLSEVTWQLKREVGVPLRRGPVGASAGPLSMERPPLLSALGAPAVPAAAAFGPHSGIQPPPPISLPGVALQASVAQPEPAPAPAPAALPARPFEPAVPSIVAQAGMARSALPGGAPSPQAARPASPPILGHRAPFGAPKPKDKPNLLVATMFGLRAFGRGKGAPPASPLPAAGQPPPVLGQRGGVLGLGRRAASRPSNEAPRWVGPREGGLPDLATGSASVPVAPGAPRDLEERLRRLRPSSRPAEGDEPWEGRSGHRGSGRPSSERGERAGSRVSSRSEPRLDFDGSSRRPRDGRFPVPWWIGGVAVALVGLVVVLLLVFGRSRVSVNASSDATQVAPAAATELPTSRLLDDRERMKALISLVHDYGGGESPELADLLNEEAALVYEVIERSCQQPGDKCDRPAPMVAGTVRSTGPQHQIQHLFEERKVQSSGRRSGGQVPEWLAGLSTPAIGVEDDPNVRRWVEYYTEKQAGREAFQSMLFRCGAYRDLIETTLVNHGMPKALLALVMTESGCVPHAESPVGARGLWQFMPATARAYHLHVKENVVDERISPPKSTEAAVAFLADLYRKMGSWEFALASYNMGPFGLSARIRRAGGDVTFWDLAAAGFLPEETAKYVPRIQAYALILENLAHFNFSTAQMRATEVTGELDAPPGTRLGMVARAASTSLDHLKLLNPDIVGVVVPDLRGARFVVQVPKEDVFRARSVLEQLLADGDQRDKCVSSAFDWGSERFTDKMCGSGADKRKRRAL